MTPFQHMLHDHRLWGIRRKNVVPALSLGLFISFLPFPGHFIFAALAALALRINVPVAALATFVVNPLTVGPLFYFAYRVGAVLLRIEPGPFYVELSVDWLTNVFISVWQPLLLGCVLLGSIAALIGYVVLDGIWRYSIHRYKTKKRNGRTP
ncbi:MAG: DUF2062 domain-containing protein [Gammaproteobacteria bacterium]|nr:DUF2062 domain-containing protein [Gammaproteobacteria bacterium]